MARTGLAAMVLPPINRVAGDADPRCECGRALAALVPFLDQLALLLAPPPSVLSCTDNYAAAMVRGCGLSDPNDPASAYRLAMNLAMDLV